MNVLIVDDNIRECEMIRSLLNLTNCRTKCVGEAHSVQEGIEMTREHEPDLILLDIELPDGMGFDILNACKDLYHHVIFITAHDHYAIRALKYSAFDYLMKPVEHDDFIRAVERLYTRNLELERTKMDILLNNLNEKHERRMGIWCQDGLHFIDVRDINYIKADGSYSRIYLSNEKMFMATKLLKEFEFLSESDTFVRTHNSYLVNIRNVKSYSRKHGGSLTVVGDTEIPVSRGRKEEVMRRLGEWVV